ncbi:hypothetical protein [Luteipulveratus halotolerans]|uniref:hypothetical protein n=1 Tax=Luteipulveratus halotolerans TaxID=1631356 RepID=UPI000680FEC1|nr:hypothetical protein [Luteipulveratus halotolerans]
MAAVLVGASLTSGDPATVGVCFQVLPYAVWPMLVAALSTLTTGLLLGWGTAYGILQRWWVVTKLALTVLMSVLIVVALQPGMDEIASRGRDLVAGRSFDTAAGDMIFPPVVSLTMLTVAVILSVFKPWGRVRSGGRPRIRRTPLEPPADDVRSAP